MILTSLLAGYTYCYFFPNHFHCSFWSWVVCHVSHFTSWGTSWRTNLGAPGAVIWNRPNGYGASQLAYGGKLVWWRVLVYPQLGFPFSIFHLTNRL